MLFLQQTDGKLPGAQTGLGDVGESVKGAHGSQAADAVNGVEALHDDLPAAAILLLHLLHRGLVAGESGHAAPLDALVDGGEHVLQELGHGGDDLLRACAVAQAEAGHGILLGKAVHHQGPLLHAGEAGDAGIGLVRPEQLVVDLIGEDVQVLLLYQIGDLAQVLRAGHAAGGVGGGIDEDHLGLGGDGGPEVLYVIHEAILLLDPDGHGHRAHLGDEAAVVGPAGIGQQHLIADVQNGGAGQAQHADGAGADEDLLGLVVQAPLLIGPGHCLPQGGDAGVGSIVGLAPLEGGHRGVDDVLGRGEVRLTQGKADHILQTGLHGEHFTDHRPGRLLTFLRNKRHRLISLKSIRRRPASPQKAGPIPPPLHRELSPGPTACSFPAAPWHRPRPCRRAPPPAGGRRSPGRRSAPHPA